MVGLKQDEQCGLIVAMQELHVNDVQQLLIQLTDINDVAGQEAGFRSADEIHRQCCIQHGQTTFDSSRIKAEKFSFWDTGAQQILKDVNKQNVWGNAGIPFSNSTFLFIS